MSFQLPGTQGHVMNTGTPINMGTGHITAGGKGSGSLSNILGQAMGKKPETASGRQTRSAFTDSLDILHTSRGKTREIFNRIKSSFSTWKEGGVDSKHAKRIDNYFRGIQTETQTMKKNQPDQPAPEQDKQLPKTGWLKLPGNMEKPVASTQIKKQSAPPSQSATGKAEGKTVQNSEHETVKSRVSRYSESLRFYTGIKRRIDGDNESINRNQPRIDHKSEKMINSDLKDKAVKQEFKTFMDQIQKEPQKNNAFFQTLAEPLRKKDDREDSRTRFFNNLTGDGESAGAFLGGMKNLTDTREGRNTFSSMMKTFDDNSKTRNAFIGATLSGFVGEMGEKNIAGLFENISRSPETSANFLKGFSRFAEEPGSKTQLKDFLNRMDKKPELKKSFNDLYDSSQKTETGKQLTRSLDKNVTSGTGRNISETQSRGSTPGTRQGPAVKQEQGKNIARTPLDSLGTDKFNQADMNKYLKESAGNPKSSLELVNNLNGIAGKPEGQKALSQLFSSVKNDPSASANLIKAISNATQSPEGQKAGAQLMNSVQSMPDGQKVFGSIIAKAGTTENGKQAVTALAGGLESMGAKDLASKVLDMMKGDSKTDRGGAPPVIQPETKSIPSRNGNNETPWTPAREKQYPQPRIPGSGYSCDLPSGDPLRTMLEAGKGINGSNVTQILANAEKTPETSATLLKNMVALSGNDTGQANLNQVLNVVRQNPDLSSSLLSNMAQAASTGEGAKICVSFTNKIMSDNVSANMSTQIADNAGRTDTGRSAISTLNGHINDYSPRETASMANLMRNTLASDRSRPDTEARSGKPDMTGNIWNTDMFDSSVKMGYDSQLSAVRNLSRNINSAEGLVRAEKFLRHLENNENSCNSFTATLSGAGRTAEGKILLSNIFQNINLSPNAQAQLLSVLSNADPATLQSLLSQLKNDPRMAKQFMNLNAGSLNGEGGITAHNVFMSKMAQSPELSSSYLQLLGTYSNTPGSASQINFLLSRIGNDENSSARFFRMINSALGTREGSNALSTLYGNMESRSDVAGSYFRAMNSAGKFQDGNILLNGIFQKVSNDEQLTWGHFTAMDSATKTDRSRRYVADLEQTIGAGPEMQTSHLKARSNYRGQIEDLQGLIHRLPDTARSERAGLDVFGRLANPSKAGSLNYVLNNIKQDDSLNQSFYEGLNRLGSTREGKDTMAGVFRNINGSPQTRGNFLESMANVTESGYGKDLMSNILDDAGKNRKALSPLVETITSGTADNKGYFGQIMNNLSEDPSASSSLMKAIASSTAEKDGSGGLKEMMTDLRYNQENRESFFRMMSASAETREGRRATNLLNDNIKSNLPVKNELVEAIAELNTTDQGRKVFADYLTGINVDDKSRNSFLEHLNKLSINPRYNDSVEKLVRNASGSTESQQALSNAIETATLDKKGQLLFAGLMKNDEVKRIMETDRREQLIFSRIAEGKGRIVTATSSAESSAFSFKDSMSFAHHSIKMYDLLSQQSGETQSRYKEIKIDDKFAGIATDTVTMIRVHSVIQDRFNTTPTYNISNSSYRDRLFNLEMQKRADQRLAGVRTASEKDRVNSVYIELNRKYPDMEPREIYEEAKLRYQKQCNDCGNRENDKQLICTPCFDYERTEVMSSVITYKTDSGYINTNPDVISLSPYAEQIFNSRDTADNQITDIQTMRILPTIKDMLEVQSGRAA